MRILAFCRSETDRRYATQLADQLGGRAEVAIDNIPGSEGLVSAVRLRAALSRNAFLTPLRIATLVRRFNALMQYAERKMTRTSADVVVLFEDNVGDATRLIGATAHHLKVPYVVLPTTIPNPCEPERIHRVNASHHVSSLLGRVAAQRWPHWIREFDGRRMLRLWVAEIAALRQVGADTPAPWVLNSGQARAICVESPSTKAIYRKLGVGEAQLVLTGSPVDDALLSRPA